jgi:hypothetical protein
MGETGSTEIGNNITWTNILEEYFATTGEKANGLSIMHKRAESIFTKRRTFIDLPVIVGSGIIAFLNAGSSSLFTDHQLAATALGVGSLFVSILNTTGTYFGWAKRAEGHRLSSIHYAKLYRFISVEMRLPRDERMTPSDFLKYVKDQYDRLAEVSPPIPGSVAEHFGKKMEKYKGIAKPEETNGLNKIEIYVDSEMPLTPVSIIQRRSSVQSPAVPARTS